MRVFIFSNKNQAKSFTVYTLIGIGLIIFIFNGLNVYIHVPLAKLLVSILSLFALFSAIRKAGDFDEISVDGESLIFRFRSRFKDKLIILKSEVNLIVNNDRLEIRNSSKKLIGRAHKNNLEKTEEWDVMLSMLSN